MREVTGDIFEIGRYGIICVTTNGVVKKDGALVMGKGVALNFANKFPTMAEKLGQLVKANGNHVYSLGSLVPIDDPSISYTVVSFPTKAHWRDNSTVALVTKSAAELKALADSQAWPGPIYLPVPGCGNGGLNWGELKQLLPSYLDDRFVIVHYSNSVQQNTQPAAQPGTQVTTQTTTLECSSQGDNRFSAFGAHVNALGNKIEMLYQEAKRFTDDPNEGPTDWRNAKGRPVVAVSLNGKRFGPEYLTPWYWYLWTRYFLENPDLLQYARQFNTFTDMFRGKSTNCQADVIAFMAKNGLNPIMAKPAYQEIDQLFNLNYLFKNPTPEPGATPVYMLNRTIKEGCSDILTCMVTGHRPNGINGKAGWNFGDSRNQKLITYLSTVVNKMAMENGTRIFIEGIAAGGDLLFTRAVLDVSHLHPEYNLQLWNYIPYPCAPDRLKYQWKAVLDSALNHPGETVICSPDPVGKDDKEQRIDAAKKLFYRNECMVRTLPVLPNVGMIIAIYSGLQPGLYAIEQIAQLMDPKTKGGTANTLLTAVKRWKEDKNFQPKILVVNPNNF